MLIFVSPIFAQEAGEKTSDEGVITGEVTSLDVSAGLITVKAEDGSEKTFSVIDGETILWKGVEDIELSNVSKGDKAEVGYYTDESGKLIASWVDVLVEETQAPATAPAETPAEAPAEGSEEE